MIDFSNIKKNDKISSLVRNDIGTVISLTRKSVVIQWRDCKEKIKFFGCKKIYDTDYLKHN